MNPLFALLNQQAAAGAVNPNDYQGQIDVVAQSSQPITPKYDDYVLNNVPAVNARAADIKETEEASQRRGMFGVKGTLRDVLGVLGDAFLIQSGNAPMYAPRRRQEQISDAMAGFTVDPEAASERVAYYEPSLGRDLYHDHETNLIRKAQAESLAASRQDLMADRAFKKYERAKAQIGSLFNTPGAVVNGTISPQALALAERIANSADMTLEEFMISEGMTEEDVRNYARSVIDPYKQERLQDYDVGLEQGQYNAESRRISAEAARTRAARPPQPRAAPQPTEASILKDIMDKPASQRTPEERAFLKRKTEGTESTRGPRTVPGANRFRPVSQ